MQDDAGGAETGAGWSYKQNLATLQSDVLDRLVAASLFASVTWLLYLGLADSPPSAAELALPVLVGGGALFAYRIGRFRQHLGAVTYVCGVLLVVWLTVMAYGDASLFIFLALAAGAAGLLLGVEIGFLAAAGMTGGLGALYLAGVFPGLTVRVVTQSSIYILLMVTLLWVALYPLRTMLQWAWRSHERERDQMEEARTSRGELSRVLSSLDVAYRRLEVLNIELERTRQTAVEARRLKAEFAANISHELRTPLNLIIGFSEMMIMSPQSYDNQTVPAAYRGDLQSIHRNAKHLSQLIDDVLDLSQIEAARMGLIREPVSLQQVVQEAVAVVGQMLKSKHLSLTIEMPPDLPLLHMDKTRVRQVLINLLNNAARFTDQGGVTISAQRREDEIVVCVADTGIGISEKDLAKVFEEFRQLDGSIRRRAGGSGLGLAISRQLIDLHGGRMWVESKEGEGASFYFSLPLHDELSAQRQHRDWELAAHVGAPLAKKDSVIVVAQEARAASLFERYLDGYRIIPASSVAGALHMLEQEQARAVINTVTSGDLGWLDPKSVQASPLSLPVVAVSLRGHKLTVQDMAVTSYLTKPVLQEHLTTVLHGLGDHVRDVLVVDDDHDTVRLLARMVRLAGSHYRVSRAYDGEQALAAMTKRRPDAVILDLLMPGIDGYEVLDRMRRTPRLKDVHVIVATARGREQESITADAFGITRPDGFAVGEVMRCLKAALDAL